MFSLRLYNQKVLINKINLYLRNKNRDLELEEGGYCHGLTLLWLYKMSEGKEKWFYDIVKKIVRCDEDDYGQIEMDIEKFIAHIEWLQNPNIYVKGLQQLNIDSTLEIPIDFSLAYHFDRRTMNELLDKIILENRMICVSTQEHTVGIFKRNDLYYFYDSNYPWNGALPVDNIRRLKSEIISRLFIIAGKPIDKMGLRINVFTNPDIQQASSKILINKEKLIKETKDIHQLSQDGTNTFYLACTSGDKEMIEKLISSGADVNQLFQQERSSGLAIAAMHYDEEIVKLLLEKGANPNLQVIGDCTALHFVAEFGYESIAKILLMHKADPLFLNEEGITPLSYALENKQYQTAAMILSFIKDIGSIPRGDIRDLRNNKWNMLLAINELLVTLPIAQQAGLKQLTEDIFKRGFDKVDEKMLFSKSTIFKAPWHTLPGKSCTDKQSYIDRKIK